MATENKIINYTVKVNEKDLSKHLSKIDKIIKRIVLTSYSTINKVVGLTSSINSNLVYNLKNIDGVCTNIENQINNASDSFKKISSEIANVANQVNEFNNTLISIDNVLQKVKEYNRNIIDSKKLTLQLFTLSNQSSKNKKGIDNIGLGLGDTNKSISNSVLNNIKVTDQESSKLDETLDDLGKNLDTSIGLFSLFADLAGVAGIILEGTAMAAGLASAGIATLAIGAIASVSYALIQYAGYTSDATELNRKHRDSIREINDELRIEKELSANNYQSSINSLHLPEKYATQIEILVDDKGNLLGNKDDLLELINAFNSSIGSTLFSYDEESDKLKYMNGEIENVGKTIDNVLTKKRGEAFVSSYLGNYQNNVQRLDDLETMNQEKKDAMKAIEDKYVKDNIDMEEMIDFLKNNNTDIYTTFQLLSEMGVDPKILENSEFLADMGDFEILKIDSEAITNDIDKLEIFKSKFEDLYLALANNDFDAVASLLDGNMMIDEMSNVDLLIEKIRLAKDNLKEVQTEFMNGTKTEEDVQKSKENLDLLLEKFKLETNLDYDEVEKQASLSGDLYGANYTEKIKTAMDTMNNEMLLNTGLTMLQNLALISSAILSYIPPSIIIPVIIDYVNGDVSRNQSSGKPKASFDDSQEMVQTFTSKGYIKAGLENIIGIQNRIGKSIHISVPSIADENYNESNTSITQNVSFNQPIQKPSDVTRAMQKASRNLRKVK